MTAQAGVETHTLSRTPEDELREAGGTNEAGEGG